MYQESGEERLGTADMAIQFSNKVSHSNDELVCQNSKMARQLLPKPQLLLPHDQS
jgi:hypothetical protein